MKRSTGTRALIPLGVLVLVCAVACGSGSGSTALTADPGPTVPATTATNAPGAPPQTPLTGPVKTAPPTTRPSDPYLPVGVVDQVFPGDQGVPVAGNR